MLIPPQNALTEYLKNGGSTNMAVDGSVTPVKFRYTVPAGRRAAIFEMRIFGTDGKYDPQTFFGQPELTNGILVRCIDEHEQVSFDLTAGKPVTLTPQFAIQGDMDIVRDEIGSKDLAIFSWKTPSETYIELHAGESVEVVVQDDLSPLTVLNAAVRGIQSEG
jgi:hypothetical protein